MDDHDHLDPHYLAPALAATRGKGTSVRWDPAWLIADAIKTANPDPRYMKKERDRSVWVQTAPADAPTWDAADEYAAQNAEESGSEGSDTEQSGPIDFYIGDDQDDHYDVYVGEKPLASTRWCDIETSDDDDEYADMGSLVDSSNDDRPNEL